MERDLRVNLSVLRFFALIGFKQSQDMKIFKADISEARKKDNW